MLNFNVTLFFSAFGPPGPLSYGVFFLTFVTYLATVSSNLILMLVIYLDTSLHKPMYIFLFNLAINGLIGSSAALPNIMFGLLDDTKYISYNNCLLQVFFINFYASCAYIILTVMAYDRYVSICKPLQYHTIMTPNKVKLLLGIVYVLPFCYLAVQLHLTSTLPVCTLNINKLFCDNLAIVSLSCVKSAMINMYGVFGVILLIVFPLLFVILSYVKLLYVSLKASANANKKALKTCIPHLITFINFSLASLFSVIYNRLNNSLPKELNVFMTVHFILVPPLLHPLIYGMKTETISKSLMKLLHKRIFAFSFHLKSKDDI